jgi:hypothetical protein
MENSKPWYLSKTVFGVLITFIGVLTKHFFGYAIPDISTDVVEIIGLCIALFGRLTAKQSIS